ncbi:Nn.00g073890.m01.CDS01 [Neocucurbitaria sp. VM-36]
MPNFDIEYTVGTPRDTSWPVRLDCVFGNLEDLHSCNTDGMAERARALVNSDLTFCHLVDLYAFADRFSANGFADLVISITLEKILLDATVSIYATDRLLEQTRKGQEDHLFTMLAEIAARFIDASSIKACLNYLPKEFLVKILSRQREIAEEDGKILLHPAIRACKWHYHAPQAYCGSTMLPLPTEPQSLDIER